MPENFFAGLYPVFCKAVGDNGAEQALNKTLKPEDFVNPLGKRTESLKARTPPVDTDYWAGYSFDFSWSGAKEGEECTRDCERAFDVMIGGECKSDPSVKHSRSIY